MNFLSAVLGHKPFSGFCVYIQLFNYLEPDGTARTKRTMSVGMLAAPPDAATAAVEFSYEFSNLL